MSPVSKTLGCPKSSWTRYLLVMVLSIWVGQVLPSHAQVGVQSGGDQIAPALAYGVSDATIGEAGVLTKPGRSDVERGFLEVTLPGVLDTTFVDNARLILTVSTVFDSTEPLIIAAFPATAPTTARPMSWSAEWDEMSGGFDPEYMAMASAESTEEGVEIAIDITQFVRLWQSGELRNNGIVIKSLGENKSTFHWIRDGRYGGRDAKVEIWHSRGT